MDSREQLIAIAIKYEGDWYKIFDALIRKEYVDDFDPAPLIAKSGCKVLTIIDADYPKYLKELFHPPFVLFYYGDISLINKRENNVAFVGSREPTELGRLNSEKIAEGLASKFTIVSGLALGIDTIAHRAAIKAKGKTIAVLGNGIDYCYPSENTDLYKIIKKHHLVISEYFGYISPDASHFCQRNRLIVCLSRATVVGEANLASGSMMTANLTLAYNNQLFCLPSSDIENSVCNKYIRDGCPIVTCVEDILCDLPL